MSTPDSAEAEVILLRPGAGIASVQGALALDLTPRTAPPRPRLRSTRASDLAELERASREQVDAFVGRYLQAAVEIAAGDRPVAQLLRHTVPEVFDTLSGRARSVTAAGGLAPGRVRGPNPARPVAPPGAPWQRLNFCPDPQGHSELRPTPAKGSSSPPGDAWTSASPSSDGAL